MTSELDEKIESGDLSHEMLVRLTITVFIYIQIYAILYYFLGARFVSYMQFITSCSFTPLIIILDKKKFNRSARLLFHISCLVYLLAPAIGLKQNTNIEYYFLVTLLGPLFIFQAKDKLFIWGGELLCVLAWWYNSWGVRPEIPENLFPINFPAHFFVSFNFIGSLIFIIIAISYFVDRYEKHSQIIIEYATARLEAERLLEEAQAIAKLGSWSFDVITGNLNCSKQLYKLFPEKIQTSPPIYEQLLSMIHPVDRSQCLEAIKACRQRGIPYHMRFRVIFPDEKLIWQEAIGSAKTDQNGKIINLSGTSQDITELVNAEEEAKLERIKSIQNAKLASLGEMAAGVAHEINNPLSIITATASSLPRFLHDSEKLALKLEQIDKATRRISKIVNALRKFSRSSDKSDFVKKPLAEIITETLVLTEAKANHLGTQIETEIETDGTIMCNEIEIEQVLINLINNGLDEIKNLDIKWIKIKLFEKNNKIVLQISDSGTGIPLEIQSKIFQPFFTTKPIGEGTGLGLSVVKGILDEHNASIEILQHSANTTFEIKFNNQLTSETSSS